MIGRAPDAGTPAAWVTGDEVDGADLNFRKAIAGRGLGFVLAVVKSHHFTTGSAIAGRSTWPCDCRPGPCGGCRPVPEPRGHACTTGP
jgi:hypothetical protein